MDGDEFLNDIAEATPSISRTRKAADFQKPTDRLRVGAVEQATVKDSLKAGQYIRRQFTFRPEQLGRIRALARQYHVPETDLVRWLVDRGILALENGESPDTIEVSTTRLASPRK